MQHLHQNCVAMRHPRAFKSCLNFKQTNNNNNKEYIYIYIYDVDFPYVI